MVNKLNISNASVFVETNSNTHNKVVLGLWSKNGNNLLIDHDYFLFFFLRNILAVCFLLAHASELMAFFRDETESLIEREVFLSLVHDLLNSILFLVLIDCSLQTQAFVIYVLANFEFGHPTELGDQSILLESAEKS